MQPTKQQIEVLKGKCPKCKGKGKIVCDICHGTGQATIKIEKEWVDKSFASSGVLGELTPKYEVGNNLFLCLKCYKLDKIALASLSEDVLSTCCEFEVIKLKILPFESETKWKVCLC